MYFITSNSECFVSRLIKNGHKSIRLNPIQSDASIQAEFLIRIIPTSGSFRLILIENSAWIDLDWFGFI